MRRLARTILRLATYASLVLAVVAAALWARSQTHRDLLTYARRNQTGWFVGLMPGRVAVMWTPYASDDRTEYVERPTGRFPTEPVDPTAKPYDWDKTIAYRTWAGVIYHKGETGGRHTVFRFTLVVVPFWLVVTVLALPSVLATGARLRRRARPARVRPQSTCPRCGYDLRATPDRCPECGRRGPATND